MIFKLLKRRRQKKELEKAIEAQQELYKTYKKREQETPAHNKTCNYCWYCIYKWDCKSPNYGTKKWNSNICARFDIQKRFKIKVDKYK